MTKTRLTILATTVLTAALLCVLAGCGLIGEQYTTIEWSTSYFEKYYPRWMDEFAEIHADKNVRIKFRAMVADAVQKVYTMMISHTLSDVIVVGTDTQALLLENMALEPIPDGFINIDDFMPVVVAVVTYPDGRLAAVPNSVGIRPYMYFDIESLKEVRTTVEEIPETYDEYRQWASKFLKWELPDGSTATGFLPADEAAKANVLRRPLLIQRGHILSIYPFILSHMDPTPDENGKSDGSLDDFLGGPPSGRPFRFDTPEFIAGLREWQKFFVSDIGAIAEGGDRIQGLTSGGYASCEAGNWIFGEVFSVNMQVTALPHAKGHPLRLPAYATAYGVSKESKHKELAMEFARFVSQIDKQLDGYYGHGYLPGRLSTWDAIRKNDTQDVGIHSRFLQDYHGGREDFIGKPTVKRTHHDRMEIYLYVPFGADVTIAVAASTDIVAKEEPEDTADEARDRDSDAQDMTLAQTLAAKYRPRMETLAADVAEMTALDVRVILRGTPPEMVAVRSVVQKSPVDVYLKDLPNVIYEPVHKLWGRLKGEVIVRASQKVTNPDPKRRMTPEEAAKWAQTEAELILAGKK